jgi:four helix bundle protein
MDDGKSKSDQLEERLVSFGSRIVALTAKLPQTLQGKHIAGQLLRSGTAAAPNYGEARGAESRADFIHKLGVALKELKETAVWLRMLSQTNLLKPESVVDILAENFELCKILNASRKTARSRSTQK